MSRNRFFIHEIQAPQPRELALDDADPTLGDEDIRYFVGVARELDRLLDDQTVVITWHLDRFDDRFAGAIVLLINDEMYQLPAYAGRVRAIFKTGGVTRNALTDTLATDPAIAARSLLREARNVVRSLQRARATPQTRGAVVHPIPLGFLRLHDVPLAPFGERPHDLFFAGSIESERGFTVRPRLVARRQMAVALRAVGERFGELVIDFSDGGPMANPAAALDGPSYSRRLADARIVLCPRGNFDETFRLMEAARCGCVAVSERLPRRWYYADCPVIELDRWHTLPDLVAWLLRDPAALAQRGAAMRAWWDGVLSEPAIARYIASHVP